MNSWRWRERKRERDRETLQRSDIWRAVKGSNFTLFRLKPSEIITMGL